MANIPTTAFDVITFQTVPLQPISCSKFMAGLVCHVSGTHMLFSFVSDGTQRTSGSKQNYIFDHERKQGGKIQTTESTGKILIRVYEHVDIAGFSPSEETM